MESWSCARCATVVTSGAWVCPACGAVAEHAGSATMMMSRPKPGAPSPFSGAEAPLRDAPAPAPGAALEWQEETPSGSMAAWKSGRQGAMVPGDVFANRFRIERLLGSGSLTTAFVARAAGVQGFVCLKLLHPRKAVDAGTVRDWGVLQQAVSRYQVPGIARVYEAGMHNDIPWCAMEYVPGPTLRMWMLEKLQFDTRVPPGLDLIQALVRIFDRVHELGCYGALKPENVVITPNGPVILDFGVPGFLTPQEFEFNAYARRYLPYMAPELRQDFANLVPQSDYYSVGALLYEILTGRPPASPVKLPSELSPVFGIEADEVVLKSLASNPNDRFGSNIGFYGALNALRDALRRQRPSSFAVAPPDMLAGDLGSAGAVHAPNLVSDPEQDFEPHLGDQNAATFPMDKPFQGMDPKIPTIAMPAVQAGAGSPNLQGSADIKGGTHSQGFPMGNSEGDTLPALEELAESASAKAPFAGEDGPKAVTSPWAALEARMTDEVVVGEGVAGAEHEVSSAAPVKSFDEEWLAAPPTPVWVWLLIAFGGLLLTAAAGYFGYHYGH